MFDRYRHAPGAVWMSVGPEHLFFGAARDLFVCLDASGLIQRVNPAWESAFGFAAAEIAGLPLAAFAHPDDPGRMRTRDGSWRFIEVLASLELEDGGRCLVAQDVTRLHEARDAAQPLLDAQANVLAVIAAAPPLATAVRDLLSALAVPLGASIAALWLVDPASNRLRCAAVRHASGAENFAAETRRLSPRRGQELAGAAWATGRAVLAPELATHASFLRDAAASRAGLRSGAAFPLTAGADTLGAIELLWRAPRAADARLTAMFESAGAAIAAFFRRERHRQAGEHAGSLGASVLERVREAILAVDGAGRVLEMNAAAERLFGRPRSAATGAPLADVVLPHAGRAEQRMRLEALLASPPAGGAVLELSGRRPDDSPFRMELVLDVARAAPLALAVLARDVEEPRRMREQLEAWQRADSIVRLAPGLMHDLANQLTVVTGHAELLGERLGPDAGAGPELLEIRSASQRAMLLTRQLATFGRRDETRPMIVSLDAIVAQMERTLSRVLGEDIQLEVHADPEVGEVEVDPAHVQQVLLNLALNARDAMPAGGRLTVLTRRVRVEEAHFAVLAVEDTGAGDTPASPGFGLSTVQSIAHRYGGEVTIAREPGVGSRFEVFLPERRAAAGALDAPPPVVEEGGSETVLLVEDDASLRSMCRLALESHGYTVLDAPTAGAALHKSREHDGPIDALVADVVLPQMSGPELAERLRAERPGLRVLFMSGHLDNAMVSELGVANGAPFLPKPFLPSALVRRLRALLDAAR
jgi:PAS domain S-box-containing protein